jgi:hypothetical protein
MRIILSCQESNPNRSSCSHYIDWTIPVIYDFIDYYKAIREVHNNIIRNLLDTPVIPKLGDAAPKGALGVSQGRREFLETGLLLTKEL